MGLFTPNWRVTVVEGAGIKVNALVVYGRQIGVWRSSEAQGLTVNDIVWPGNEHVAPPGVPDMFHIKVRLWDTSHKAHDTCHAGDITDVPYQGESTENDNGRILLKVGNRSMTLFILLIIH